MTKQLGSSETESEKVAQVVAAGGVVAYPAEGVFGLGCSPYNQQAVETLCRIKRRPITKGLIVIANSFAELQCLTQDIPKQRLSEVLATWPGPVTWVFPASLEAPTWVTGAHESIALRIPDYEPMRRLCQLTGPLISTSANIAGEPAALNAEEVKKIFNDELDYILDLPIGNLQKSTPIFDVLSEQTVRC